MRMLRLTIQLSKSIWAHQIMVTENFQEITLMSDPYRKYDLLQRLTLGDEITESKTDEKPKYASSQHNQSP